VQGRSKNKTLKACLPFYYFTILPFYYFAILLFCHFTILPLYYFTILPFCHFTIWPFYYLTISLIYYPATILLSRHFISPSLTFPLHVLLISPLPPSSPPALPPSANLNCSFVLLSQMFFCLLSQTFLCFFILGFIFSLQASAQALFLAPFPVLHGYYISSTPRSQNYWQLFSTELYREPWTSIFYGPFLQFTWTGGLFYLMSVLLNVFSLTLNYPVTKCLFSHVFSLTSFLLSHIFFSYLTFTVSS
jgi:hypothetical protein